MILGAFAQCRLLRVLSHFALLAGRVISLATFRGKRGMTFYGDWRI
jgi:hypothetical protein